MKQLVNINEYYRAVVHVQIMLFLENHFIVKQISPMSTNPLTCCGRTLATWQHIWAPLLEAIRMAGPLSVRISIIAIRSCIHGSLEAVASLRWIPVERPTDAWSQGLLTRKVLNSKFVLRNDLIQISEQLQFCCY